MTLDMDSICKSVSVTQTRFCKTQDDEHDEEHSKAFKSPSSMVSYQMHNCSCVSFHDDDIQTMVRGVSPMSSCVSGSMNCCRWNALKTVVDARLSSLGSKEEEEEDDTDDVHVSAFDNCMTMGCDTNAIVTATSNENKNAPIIHVESVNNAPRETLQQYIEYGRFLGEGSSGSVYHALVGGEERAVKVMVCTDQDLKSVLTESELGCGLNHPNIARVFSYRVSEIVPGDEENIDKKVEYLVEIEQEMCDKGSLRELIKTQTFFVEREDMSKVDSIALVTLDIASALLYLKSCGISHNDISSNNILFVSDSLMPLGLRAKVIDFGMASPLLGNTAAVGTMAYMPPEALLAENQCDDNIEDRKDVYSLGVLIIEMWQGELVWDGLFDVQILYAMSIGRRVTIPDDMPLDLASIVHKCLSDDPKARPDISSLYHDICSIVSMEGHLSF
jgi:hypothetical protein